MVSRIINMVKTVEETIRAADRCSGVARSLILVAWRPPAADTLKLNTDASLEGGSGRAFGGGLFRDATGTWRYGFVVNIGLCSILSAELWCLLHGLRLAKALGFRKLEVESDSFIGISMIKGNFEVSINCRAIVQCVHNLAQDFDSVVVNHLHREGNFAADFLSHYAYSFSRGVHTLETPPIGLSIWLLHDRLRISYVR
ncbi:hypothetical protein AAHA92_14631 [Salvia divinorum]|uniref:RNase H type-1 domain-containing protein n=1 Tax=Salvia divinorum TaxID=28513 RepID=A0ABD1HC57_SALDI